MPKDAPAPTLASAAETSDAQEIERRRKRARDEKLEIENRDPEYPVFANFEVRSGSGRTYAVEIRDLQRPLFHCTCQDFRANGLGTCKHVEAVLLTLKKQDAAAWREAGSAGSTRIEIVPDAEAGALRIERGEERLAAELRARFDGDGYLLEEENEERVLRELGEDRRVRISQEVEPWREARGRAAERKALRREYEHKVQSGEWPPQETLVPLFPYQREGMLHLAFTERALLADQMGLGKTIQAIAACALLHRLRKAKRVLVVVPASLKGEWEEQIVKFTALPYAVIKGNSEARAALYREPGFFYIANYEQVMRDVETINAALQPDIVILDEAQRIKNWNTRTAQMVKRLSSRYAFVLTGTPIENRLDDLHSLMDFLDPAILGPLFRLNRDYYSFDAKGRPVGYRNLDKLRERVAPYLLRRRQAEVETELPDRVDRTHLVPLALSQRDNYRHLAARASRLAELSGRRPLQRGEQRRLLQALQTMRILCDTAYILNEKERGCPKLAELAKLLEECRQQPGTKVVIFSEWERMLLLVRELCQRLNLGTAFHTGQVSPGKRRAEIHRFREDADCRVFITSDVGSTGLNLQVASVVINCDVPWRAARLEQRVARVWRKFQSRAVTVINLVTESSIEHRLLVAMSTQEGLAAGVLDDPRPGNSLPIRRGRAALFDRIRGVVLRKRQPAETERDTAAVFVERLATLLGGHLHRCEERWPNDEGPPVLLVTVERDASAWRERVTQMHARLYPEESRGGAPVPRIEVVDREAAETLRRMEADGLITSTAQSVRTLWPREVATPRSARLSDAREVHETVRLAESHLQGAEQAESADAARSSLREAILLLGRAFALHRHLPEPATCEEALTGDLAESWGATILVLWLFAQDERAEIEPALKAVREVIADLDPKQSGDP